MNRNIVIVSTYPEHGSKNIGDRLITNKLKAAISRFGDYSFTVVWRADDWDSVKKKILCADHVFFACLAIRKNMDTQEYPYLKEVAKNNVPFSVISAGTDLKVNFLNSIFDGLSSDSRSLLSEVNNKSVVSTTRGYLTQEFCSKLELDRFEFSGDIAFFDDSVADVKFVKDGTIDKIVVSDPHRPRQYIIAFSRLVDGLKASFSNAKITVALHGVNPIVEEFCIKNKIDFVKIYEQPDTGLGLYDSADMHVGFRVHAHVSALSRRAYSYLLEQDGRGCDYGLTINRKISVPCYPSLSSGLTLKAMVQRVIGRESSVSGAVSISPVEQILAMINADRRNGFDKFVGLEEQIESFNQLTLSAVGRALGKV